MTTKTDKFKKLEPSLGDSAIFVPQCFDNQWTTQGQLYEIFDKGLSLETPEVKKVREKIVRNEYIRGLVNGRKVVINRAFIYNNPVISRDFDGTAGEDVAPENRENFKKLIAEGTITPFFLFETSPTQEPPFERTKAFDEWVKVCDEVSPHCMRLSWESPSEKGVDKNKNLINQKLARRFHEYAASLWHEFGTDQPAIFNTFGLEPDTTSRREFEGALRRINEFCNGHFAGKRDLKEKLETQIEELNKAKHKAREDDKPDIEGQIAEVSAEVARTNEFVLRDDVYKNFIVKPDTPVPSGEYDPSRPYARYIKQLLDLRYNTNLSDAINGYAITPVDSLQRSALQELTRNRLDELEANDFKMLIKGLVLEDVQQNLWLKSMAELDLGDVIDVRGTDEWQRYISNLENLLKGKSGSEILRKASEGNLVAGVFQNYIDLAGVMTQRIVGKRQARKQELYTEKVKPVLDIVIEVAGNAVHIVHTASQILFFNEFPSPETIVRDTFATHSATGLTKKASSVVVRFAISNSVEAFTKQRYKSEMANSFDFLRGYVESPYDLFIDLQEFLRESGYEHSETLERKQIPKKDMKEDATMNFQEDEDLL